MRKKISTVYEDLFFVSEEEIDGLLKAISKRGDRDATFVYARWLIVCADSYLGPDSKARILLEGLYEEGSMEAAAELSELCYKGIGGPVDRERASKLLEESVAAGCDYGRRIMYRILIYGQRGLKADPQRALDDVLAVIAEREKKGLEPDPWLTYYRGCAVEQLEGRIAAKPFYEEAAQGGVIRAWLDLVAAYGYGDNDELTDHDAYRRYLIKGAEHKSADCALYLELDSMSRYAELPMFTRLFALKQFFIDMEKAFDNGSDCAAVFLGDIHYYGEYDQEPNMSKAWAWYVKASERRNVYALEKMFAMIKHGKVERSQEEADEIALKGARLDSKYLLAEAVIAFTQGRLQEHADEINRYYEPIFDSEDFFDGWSAPENDTWVHIDDDDLPDDDGRFDAYS